MIALADLELVDVGATVFALDLNEDTDADYQQVKGGVVYAIETHRDAETGEVQRRFMTATPWRGVVRFGSVRAEEVRQVELPNASVIRALIRQAAKVVAVSKGSFGSDIHRCVSLQHKLMAALG